MKKIHVILLVFFLLTSYSYAVSEDSSIIDELDAQNTQELDIDFSLKSFQSCEAFEDVMEEYVKTYWENSYKNRYDFKMFSKPLMQAEVMEDSAISSNESAKQSDGVG